jgi:hypothetical protein
LAPTPETRLGDPLDATARARDAVTDERDRRAGIVSIKDAALDHGRAAVAPARPRQPMHGHRLVVGWSSTVLFRTRKDRPGGCWEAVNILATGHAAAGE